MLEAETETAELAPGGQICCCGAVEPSACLGRPSMTPRSAGAKVFSSASTPCSRALASQVRTCALQTSRVHGRSTTGTPWIFARRLKATKEANEIFLGWCREWISESYGVETCALHAARTDWMWPWVPHGPPRPIPTAGAPRAALGLAGVLRRGRPVAEL